MRSLQDHVLIVGYGPSERRIINFFFFILHLIWSLTNTVEGGMLPFMQLLLCCCFSLRENNERSVLTALLCVCISCQRGGHISGFSL